MKKVQLLHVASFVGNIGDNANHNGTYSLLKSNLADELHFNQVEIRDFYYKKRFFDESFVDLVNKHDICLIGGGNYFELWVENSATGTSIDLRPELLAKIKKPLVFYSLGVDAGQGVSEERLERFKRFLDEIFKHPQMRVSIRNDGSAATVKKYLGASYLEKMSIVPDGGFFVEVDDCKHPELGEKKRNIVINLAGDMLERRFPGGSGGSSGQNSGDENSYLDFLTTFSNSLSVVLEKNEDLQLVFVPHIFRDVRVFGDLLDCFSDPIRRQRISIAPYLQGAGAERYLFDTYRKADLSLGMRFHANVCPIGLGTPSIGLVCYPQVHLLYEELGILDRTIDVSKKGFESGLTQLIETSLREEQAIRERYSKITKQLKQQVCNFHKQIGELIAGN